MLITGDGTKRNKKGGFDVHVDGRLLDPKPSQKLVNHSPDGFAWGYAGSGPSQLALALCILAAHRLGVPVAKTTRWYQDLTHEFVAKLDKSGFSVEFDLIAWLQAKNKDLLIVDV